MDMFCYQCEQTAKGTACTNTGVCGKDAEVAALQDLLVFRLRGIAYFAHRARQADLRDEEIDRFTVEALFTTVTNVNFDARRMEQVLRQSEPIMQKAREMFERSLEHRGVLPSEDDLPEPARTPLPQTREEMYTRARRHSIPASEPDENIRSLKELLTYGLKGMAAYADHAAILGKKSEEVYAFFHEALDALNRSDLTTDTLFDLCMRCGGHNIETMGLLDAAHTDHLGHPRPVEVATGTRKGPAIIVSGHDMYDLEQLLQQTEGTGIQVYTHGEMLPAHGYPGLHSYDHLAGHFGTAWQNQQKEFDAIPAAILFTTNCIQKPRESYKDRTFTTGLVAWPGVQHIGHEKDFTPVIEKAKALGGFEATRGKPLMTGFGHEAVLNVADTVVNGVKNGRIRHFFLIGGCDGAKPGRNYYTEFAEQTPADTMILTLACGKFRINHLELGEIDGLPRLLDVGQCNDAYSAITIAQALATQFDCSVNELPLSFILSWYEQKAVVILLSLLSLGIKNIRIGPTLPAFVSPAVLNVLADTFDIAPISTPQQDLDAILQH
jgi:hydroxylamine reductase